MGTINEKSRGQSRKVDEYLGTGIVDKSSYNGTGDPIVGYSDYGNNYSEDDELRKGYVKHIQGEYFEGYVNPSDYRTVRDDDYSRRESELHEETQELLGNLGINKA